MHETLRTTHTRLLLELMADACEDAARDLKQSPYASPAPHALKVLAARYRALARDAELAFGELPPANAEIR